ncbi:hypothetical protein QJQ45_018623 [Haematococcus lacustris]|nr:hypothetical protein QJQ45_018623 [Haematococcus lacustris]
MPACESVTHMQLQTPHGSQPSLHHPVHGTPYQPPHPPNPHQQQEQQQQQQQKPLLPAGSIITDLDMFKGRCVLYGSDALCQPKVWVLELTQHPAALQQQQPQQSDQRQQQQQREQHEGWCTYQAEQQQQQQLQPQPPPAIISSARVVAVPLPPWVRHVEGGLNADPCTPCLRLSASSPTHPPHTWDYDFTSHRLRLLAGPDPASATTSGQGGGSSSGTAASVGAGPTPLPQPLDSRPGCSPAAAERSLLVDGGGGRGEAAAAAVKQGQACQAASSPLPALRLTAPAPVLLLVYGAYGQPLSLKFDPLLLSLIERGWVVAWAHVRGGGERGRAWHAAGRHSSKLQGLADLTACMRWLLQAGVTRPGMIAGHAFSAGGLLLGCALAPLPGVPALGPLPTAGSDTGLQRMQRMPEAQLFGAAVLRAPFLDLMSVMRDPSLPLTLHEYDEWGNPHASGDDMQATCPYTRLGKLIQLHTQAGAALPSLPPTMVSCAVQDARVPYWAAVKWVARARRWKHAMLVLRVSWDDGHYLADDDLIQLTAEEYAFLCRAMQLKQQD